MRRSSWHRLAFNLHLLGSLAFGLFISVIALTGAFIGFEPEIDRFLHRDIAYVKPGERFLTLSQLQQAAALAYPDQPVVAVLPAIADDHAWQVVLPSGIAYFNPYTGQPLGLRTRGESLLSKIRSVHVGLTGGPIGGALVRWSTVAALPLLVTGIFLWWPGKPFRLRGTISRRLFWLDLHNNIGIGIVVFLFLLASTGAAMSFSDELRPWLYKISGGSPTTYPAYTAKLSEKYQLTPDRALEIARTAAPQATPYRIQLPAFGGAYVVDLVDRSDRVLGERHSVTIDPDSGAILLQRNPEDVHTADRWMAAIAKLHIGSLVGTTGKALFCIASLLTVASFGSGMVMMLLRSLRNRQSLLR